MKMTTVFQFDLQRHDGIIDRTAAEALIPEDVSREIVQGAVESSTVMQITTRLPDMPRAQRRMPVLASLPTASYINGDTGRKPITKQSWENKFIDAEELAVIVPIPENVLNDTDYDIWGQVRPRISEAFGLAFDAAVYYGTDGFGGTAPSSWPTAIVPAAIARGHAVTHGTGTDLYEEIFGEGGVISFVEEDGFAVTAHVAALTMRAKLRGLRDKQDRPLFLSSMQDAARFMLDGADMRFPRNGAVDPDEALMISGDWSQLVWALRQDITFKVLDQAVIQAPDGSILYNLAQQDMVALRCVMRLGWNLPNPINRVNPDENTRLPFGVLVPEGS